MPSRMPKFARTARGSCLHIKRLSNVHLPTLTKLIAAGVKYMKNQDTRA